MFEEYKDNAWGTRIVKDYPKMPPLMQRLFIASHYMAKINLTLSTFILLFCTACLALTVKDTWIVGGNDLISDSEWLSRGIVLFILYPVATWVLPVLINLAFDTWYRSAKGNF